MSQQLGGKRARHWRKIEAQVTDYVPVRIVWHVIECKCGWSSPLCTTWARAADEYDRHVRRDARPRRLRRRK